MPVDPGTIALAALSMGASMAPTIAKVIPGPMERRYRQQVKADLARLAGGAGLMSAGERGQVRAEGYGGIQSQVGEALARLQRGGGGEEGASGVREAQKAAVQQGALQAGTRLESDVRTQDLAAAAAHQKELARRMEYLIALSAQKKGVGTEAGAATPDIGATLAQFYTAGQTSRATTAQGVDAAVTSATAAAPAAAAAVPAAAAAAVPAAVP